MVVRKIENLFKNSELHSKIYKKLSSLKVEFKKYK